MAKFYGVIGYAKTVETSPGVWEEQFEERTYCGDVTRYSYRTENSGNLNDDVTTNNAISIVGDEMAFKNSFAIRYVEWMGVKWKVTNIEFAFPRLILSLGGVFNGPTGWPTRGAV